MEILKNFLTTYREEILEISEIKARDLAGPLGTSRQLKQGPTLFYDQLAIVLKVKYAGSPPKEMLHAATEHGKECLRLGYSLSHVVHSYGAICQAITQLATVKNVRFTPEEFNILNSCLDLAISAAVSEYEFRNIEANEQREVKHLGFLVHELRSALSSATIAHDMIRAGLVGTSGSTSALLEENLIRMRNLIDRSFSELRMRADADLYIEKFRLSELFDQIIITAKLDAEKKKQILLTDFDQTLEIEADRQIVVSVLANLVQNAIKYTKPGGEIWIKEKVVGENVKIEVQDECGGLEVDKMSSLFDPYVQESEDHSGLGLGLAIVRRAVHLSQGSIEVHNRPGEGCSFVVEIPVKPVPEPSKKVAVSGTESVQPGFRRKDDTVDKSV